MTQQRRVQTQHVEDVNVPPSGETAPSDVGSSQARVQNNPAAGQGMDQAAESEAALQMEGVYIISVAARILDMHPQTLRKYERLGLVRPGRTLGMLRLYSTEDIRKLRLIRYLSDEMGLNLAGVEFVLTAVQNLLTMRQRLTARLGPEAGEAVSQELELLFRSLNLPVDH